MRIRISAILLFGLCSLSAPSYSLDSAPTLDDLIIWEVQNWKPGGGYKRLTLWRDGYSEAEVAVASTNKPHKPREGWELIREGRFIRYVRRYAYSPRVTRTKFSQALRAGIRRLKSFKSNNADGRDTRIVISLDGKRRETVIPEFGVRNKNTLNHRRYLAVAKILDAFDTNAYVVPGAKPSAAKNTADKSPDKEHPAPSNVDGKAKTPDTEKPATPSTDSSQVLDTEKPSDTTPATEIPASEASATQ